MVKGRDFVAFHPAGGEMLIDVARTYTLSAAYWEALANFNGAPEWLNVDWRLKPGETVGIPVAWLTPAAKRLGADFGPGVGVAPSGSGVAVTVTGSAGVAPGIAYQRNVGWLMLAGAAALLALMVRGDRKRGGRRRRY